MSGGDTRGSVQYGLGPGLAAAVVARRSGGSWNIVAFRYCGDRGVSGSTHYGRCSGSKRPCVSAATYRGPLRGSARRTKQ